MANKEGHRRFGNIRRRPSGRYQIRYPGPDGRMRTGPETYARSSDADKALTLVEAAILSEGVGRPGARQGQAGGLRRDVDRRAARPSRPHSGPVNLAAGQAHLAAPRRRPGREAVHADDPAMAGQAARQRCIRLDGG